MFRTRAHAAVVLVAGVLLATRATNGFSERRPPLSAVASTDRRPNGRSPTETFRALSASAADVSVEAGPSSGARDEYEPFRGRQPREALSEIFIPQVMSHLVGTGEDDGDGSTPDLLNDERLWVPQTETVSFRPLCLCVSGGYYVNLLRVRGSGLLSRHRHPGPVHGHVLKGRWRYLEHDWEAVAGSYIFEPPGETHTLVVPEGVEEMITMFHVTGSLLYCDPEGNVVGAEDVFTKLELAKKHYAEVGLGEDFVQQFVR